MKASSSGSAAAMRSAPLKSVASLSEPRAIAATTARGRRQRTAASRACRRGACQPLTGIHPVFAAPYCAPRPRLAQHYLFWAAGERKTPQQRRHVRRATDRPRNVTHWPTRRSERFATWPRAGPRPQHDFYAAGQVSQISPESGYTWVKWETSCRSKA